jgi:7-cyano-7-deazaguanine synthase
MSSCSAVTVLLSGGLDSAVCVAYYLELGSRVRCLFIDWGQSAAADEWTAAQCIADALDVPVHRMELTGLPPLSGKIRGRNALLVCLALMEAPSDQTSIAIGIHAGTTYEDCSPEFLEKMRAVFDLYTDGRVRLEAPFLRWSKETLVGAAARLGVPTALTYSCEAGGNPVCGVCASCRDRERLNVH